VSEDIHTLPEDPEYQAAEYALGLAEGDHLRSAQTKVQTDPGFAARVAGWQERFVAMTDSIAPVAPRRRVKKALMATLFPKQKVALLDRLWVWKGFTLAALVLAAYVSFPTLRPEPVEDGTVYATQMQGDSTLQILAVLNPTEGAVTMRVLAGEAPEGRVLELWAILPEQDPLSLGVLPGGESVQLPLPADLAGVAGLITLAITDEPSGGAPEGVPTGSIMAIGAVSEI
jgi:anti-sigma-K factor RskA